MSSVLILLTVSACLSPLLTASALWQVKEWRVDRLREHLRSEGALRTLFGISRPAIIALTWLFLFSQPLQAILWPALPLSLLLAVSVLQATLKRQRRPVWTSKAVLLIATAFLFSMATAAVMPPVVLPLVPLFSFVALLCAWMVWLPIDRLLKKRVFERARALRNAHPEVTVIGITGSAGKTTTKELLAHLLKDRGARATPAYVNSEMGVSQWLIAQLSAAAIPPVLIVEMGAYRKGEIELLCRIAKPAIGIVTFVGNQHVALFGSQEALIDAKSELLESLPKDGLALLNGDSTFARGMAARARCPSRTVGTGDGADLEAVDIEETHHGLKFAAGSTLFSLPLHGTHNVGNVLLAIAASERLGMDRETIARSLASFRPPQHTFAVQSQNTVTLLDDTHNSSPASFSAAIAWAKSQPYEHKTLITCGLIELGEAEDRIHGDLGVEAKGLFDRVIFLHSRHAVSFERGYGAPVELLKKSTPSVPSDSLLVCVGRISAPAISRLLPH